MAVNPDDFEVTDTSPPPKSSIAYTDCGAQKIATECLLIPYSWGSAPGEVVRVRSTEEKLDQAISALYPCLGINSAKSTCCPG